MNASIGLAIFAIMSIGALGMYLGYTIGTFAINSMSSNAVYAFLFVTFVMGIAGGVVLSFLIPVITDQSPPS